MSVYLVTWDLNQEKYNYSQARAEFISQISAYDNVKDPGLDSVMFISTNESANEISKYLRQKLDDNDRLIVTKLVSGDRQGQLSGDIWKWIRARD